jgi:hypothetical protein
MLGHRRRDWVGIFYVSQWRIHDFGQRLKTDDTVDYSYCVSGNTLTWTPKSSLGTITGTVVFQRSGSPGTGGAGAAAARFGRHDVSGGQVAAARY